MISLSVLNFSKMKSKSAPLLLSTFIAIFSLTSKAQTVPNSPLANIPVNSFVALCYHDVSNGFLGNAFSLRKKDFIDQLNYLKAHYNVVSLQDILDANQGKKQLPPKAVLITVDDGLASFYENIFPLLKQYKFKAVFSIVGKWTEDGAAPDYGFKDSNPKMASWKQLKEMVDSGWVDVVSHTYDMHQSQIMNPQGNQAAVASFFKYDPAKKSYQSETDFLSSVEADLKKNNELIKKHLGKDNSVIVWPYGASNALSIKATDNAGLPIRMTLRAGLNNASDLSQIGRGLIFADMEIPQFATALEQAFVEQGPIRMIRVDLDSIWKKSEGETEQTLGDLLEQTLDLGANGVLLQAISDSGDAYFPTAALKVKGDYLSRIAHTMRYRARVPYVFARLPQSLLKNAEAATTAIRDLAKFTDLDGVFFDMTSKDKFAEVPFESFMAAARSVRPTWKFGLIGQTPLNADLFDYVLLTAIQLEKEKAKVAATSALADIQFKPGKFIVALPQDYKSEASHLVAQGYLNLYYDVNFKGFVPDTDFRNVFSTRPVITQHTKGEAK